MTLPVDPRDTRSSLGTDATVADLEDRMTSAVSLTQRILDVDAEVGTRDRRERLTALTALLASELDEVQRTAAHVLAALTSRPLRG